MKRVLLSNKDIVLRNGSCRSERRKEKKRGKDCNCIGTVLDFFSFFFYKLSCGGEVLLR